MSGHSKWSKVKHQKEATDAVKGKIFTKMAAAIIIAVKEGSGDTPASNFRLRLAIEKAKSVNMPKENINRAIERGKKSNENDKIAEIVYEAFGPSGVGLLIKSVTDNKQRTVSELKNTLERSGGVLVSSGAVSHMFITVGMISIDRNNQNSETVFEKAIEAGAIDFEDTGEKFVIYTQPQQLHRVGENLQKEGIAVESFELIFKPESGISITSENEIIKLNNLINILEEREDVLKVYSNYKSAKNV